MRTPSLGTGACLVCLDVGTIYADILQVGVLAQFLEDLLDQAAFRPLLESLVVVIPEGAVSIASRAFADW